MSRIIDNKYRIQIASDVIRDGIGCELFEFSKSDEKFVAEIFRNDSKKIIEFTSDAKDVPLNVIEKLIVCFKEEIGHDFQ